VKDVQNITLALPRRLLKRAKRLAAERETSVSAILAEALAGAVDDVERYEAARRRHLSALRKASDLGTGGRAGWTRDTLHDR
jgi:ferritin-like metal-binding protein YciE